MPEERNGWSADQVKAFVLALLDERDLRYEQRFLDQQRAVDVAIRSAAQATEKASAAMDKRIEAMNEFRGQLADQAARLMPRAEAQVIFGQIQQVIDRNRDDITGKLDREYYTTEHTGLARRVAAVEAGSHDLLTRTEFTAYQIRQEENMSANRRAAASSYVAVGLAILGMVITIVLFITGIR